MSWISWRQQFSSKPGQEGMWTPVGLMQSPTSLIGIPLETQLAEKLPDMAGKLGSRTADQLTSIGPAAVAGLLEVARETGRVFHAAADVRLRPGPRLPVAKL